MQDKTVVITGGTSGIGEVAAVALAKMGARRTGEPLICSGIAPSTSLKIYRASRTGRAGYLFEIVAHRVGDAVWAATSHTYIGKSVAPFGKNSNSRARASSRPRWKPAGCGCGPS
jgi:hypothetical protein